MSRGIHIVTRYLPVALATALMAACGGGSGGTSNDCKPTTGSMKLSVTDAPVDSAEAVWVQFRAVEFKPQGGDAVMQELKDAQGAAAPRRINLLPLQDGRTSVLLDGVQLPGRQLRVVAPARRQRDQRARLLHRHQRQRVRAQDPER